MKNIWKLFAVLIVAGGFAACNEEEDKPVEEDIRFVDLGLSVKWAKCNLGATSPEGYDWNSYRWCEGTYNSLLKYNNNGSFGVVDNKVFLDPEDDAAHVALGGDCRLPANVKVRLS